MILLSELPDIGCWNFHTHVLGDTIQPAAHVNGLFESKSFVGLWVYRTQHAWAIS